MTNLARKRLNYVFKDEPSFAPVTRKQVAGADTVLKEIEPLIERVKSFSKEGAELPCGAVFYGPRGTGKTYLSRFFATTCKARFVDIRGFPIPESSEDRILMPQDIGDLIRLGLLYIKKTGKPIVFFYDEIEEADDEIFEKLRVEIDGIRGRVKGMFFLFTSSVEEPEMLDPGLFRSGRVSVHVPFLYPSARCREDLLGYYVSRVSHEKDMDLASMAQLLPDDVTPADIMQLVSDAYSDSTFEQSGKTPKLEQKHLVGRCLKKITGFVTDTDLDEKNRRVVAFHEVGHAVVARALGLPVQAVILLPAIDDGAFSYGKTIINPQESKLVTIDICLSLVAAAFGASAVEKLFGFKPHSGSASDWSSATAGAEDIVGSLLYGSNRSKFLGPMVFNRDMREYSESVRLIAERDIVKLLKDARDKAWRIVKKVGKRKLEKIAEALMDKKVLLQKELDELLK